MSIATSPAAERSPSERLVFLKAWAANPLKVAALAPSSRALSALVARQVDSAAGPVIELGAGTGPVTQALVEWGVPQCDLVLVETSPMLAAVLRERFPTARTLEMDAARLGDLDLFGGRKAAAVVSGVPVLTMPKHVVAAVLRAAFAQLASDGAFYQYSYSWRCPVPPQVLAELGLTAARAGITFGNLPPGLVYRITRSA